VKNIWQFQEQLTRRLRDWALFSIIVGGFTLADRNPLRKGIGVQFVGWGVVNYAIALLGSKSANKREKSLPDPNADNIQQTETHKLTRLLLINTGLDVFYILGGFFLIRNRGRKDPHWQGQGVGIIFQGLFLYIFDLIHALILLRR
jgi:hypothetical protein